MDAHEAREHLEMVDRILSRADNEPVRYVPGLIIAWGIAAALMCIGGQLALLRIGGAFGDWLSLAAFAAGVLYSVAASVALWRSGCYDRVSTIEKRMGRTIGAVWFTVAIASLSQPHVFAAWGGAAVWSMGAAIMMLMSGFSGDKRGLAGGLILLASVLAANYAFPQTPGYALAAGFIFGYAIPGVLFLQRAPQEAA